MRRSFALLLALLLPASCARDDFSRTGTWQPTGVNAHNLQAMLSDPADSVRGVAAPDSRGTAAAAPINRLIGGQLRPLPVTGWGPSGRGTDAR